MDIMRNGKYFLTAVLLLNLLSVAFAGTTGNTATTGISSALAQLCSTSRTFLGMAIMLMILLAGATYAIGQVLGAETRARATVWATAMITGAIIGALIYIITPVVIQALLASAVSC